MKPLKPPRAVRSPNGLYALFALLFLSLAVGGGWLYRTERAAAERRVHANLEAVSRLKAEQIVRWRQERLNDAADIASCAFLRSVVDRWLNQHTPEAREMLLARFQGLQRHHGFSNILLVDAEGRLRLSLGGKPDELHPETLQVLVKAMEDGRPALSDLHPDPDGEHVHFDAVAPLFAADGRPLGAVILVSLAEDFLYPLIQSWPTASQSAETLLVRRDGDDVLFLNELRHQKGSALKLRVPLSDVQLPEARAIRDGTKGVVEGRDYRGVPVLAEVRPIPDTPWFLVTKIDTDEAYADWRERSLLLLLLIAATALTALGGLFWLRRSAAHYQTLLQAETEIRRDREQQATLRELLENTLQDGSLQEVLERCLKQILGVSWLAVLPKGGVFLMREDGQSLSMAASHNLAPEMLAICGNLPLGHCLCGLAAESRELQYAAHLDERHEVHYPGMAEHGHYALPLISDGMVLGVLVLYLPVGFVRDPMKEQFLSSVADILAGLIRRARQAEALRERESMYRSMAETSGDGFWLLDTQGRIVESNEAYARLSGYRQAELRGKHILDFNAEHTPEVVATRMEKIRREGHDLFQTRHRAKDGHVWPVEVIVSYSPVAGGRYFSFLRDITERRQTEEALEDYGNRLEELVAERTAELEAAREEAERLARVRSDFLANMSHEIRTPLNAVLGLARMGERDSAHRKAQDNFRRIVESGRHLLGVVNDILDFSKIEAGKLELEQAPFELGKAIDQAVALTAAQAYAKGLEFEVLEAADLPEQVQGDLMRLTQVLVNLLSNAVKFTEHGSVSLEVERDGEGLVFRVRDSGIGMAPEQTARLFAAFEQGDNSTTRKYGGTGLGLAISKRLVDAMGGEIRVESRPGEGSLFEIRLPIPLPAAPDRTQECGRIRLAGLDGREAHRLSTELARHGLEVEVVSPARAFASPWPDRLVLSNDALEHADLVQAAVKAVDNGLRLLLLVTPGSQRPLPEALSDRVTVIERPLRLRHLLCLSGEAEQAAERRGASARLAGLRVLAAEDVEVNRLVLEDVLLQEGAEVAFAEDGQQAVERVREEGETAFDVVLMDIQMPVLDGYAATRQIRELAPGLPVIGLTAHALAEERARCLAAGMREHVSKPIDVEALVAAVLRHALRHSPQEEGGSLPPPQGEGRGEGETIARSSTGLDAGEVSPSSPALLPGLRPPHPTLSQGERVKRMDSGMMPDTGVGQSTSQPIDWPALEARFPGREDFVVKLVDTVLENNTATPARLRELAAGGDYDALAFLAHSLKGMAGNLMAGNLQELARQTEEGARAGQADSPARAEELAVALEGLLAAMRERTR